MPTKRRLHNLRSTRAAPFVVTGLAGLTLAVGSALAAPSPNPPPTPMITSGPTGPTTATSASFTYTDSQSGVSFQCKLDGGAYASCPTSGKTYTGLVDGPHTFSVVAQKANGPLSAPATRNWSVDTTAPVATATFPVAAGIYNTTAWNAGCPGGVGICGTATDMTGVAAVEVALYQGSNPNPSFTAAFLSTPNATSTAWRLAASVPTDGTWTIRLRAKDTLGNVVPNGSQPRITFQIESVPPPAPTITDGPDDPTTSTNAHFDLADSEAGVSFECRLDGGVFSACGASVTFRDLSESRHCFDARAVDAAGNRSDITSYCWTVLIDIGFPISGEADGPFYPGATRSVNLVIGNPNNFTIRVTSVTIIVDPVTSSPACAGDENLNVTQSLLVPVDVPADSTRSLEQLGVDEAAWPKLTMPNLPKNQDACKATTFALHYSGQATKP